MAGTATATEMAESTATETAGPTATETERETATETSEPATTEAGEETTTVPVEQPPELPTYEFAEGESYTYDAFIFDPESEEGWSVTSVDGDDLTVERETTANGQTGTDTHSGTQENILDVIEEERDISLFPVARGGLVYGEGRELTAGDSYRIATPDDGTDWDSETVDVEGETTVNGVTCTELTVTPDIENGEQNQRTVCLADGYPFPITFSVDSGGATLIDMTLTDATRP